MEIEDLYQIFTRCPKITTDTRKEVKDSLFFALKGENFNGNKFAESAIEKGAAFALVDDVAFAKSENYILVDDTLLALQQLASHHRSKLKIPVIGITGSNGKTTTKELIAKVLRKKLKTVFTQGNLNNHIGVPISVLSIKEETEIAVIEMGANHKREIFDLCLIARPTYGIITNIGKAHLEGFGSFEGVIKAKSELYKFILQNHGKVFVNNNNPLLDELSKNIPRITFGAMPDTDCHGTLIPSDAMIKIKWDSSEGEKIIQTKLHGAYNFENAMAAICIGNFFKVNPEDIIQAIESYQPDNRRSEIIQSNFNYIIMDAYNANPSSMELALNEFFELKGDKKTIILGDMLEMGEFAEEEHQNILQTIEDKKDIDVILVGETFHKVNRNPDFKAYKHVNDLSEELKQNRIQGRKILIKGSRGIQLEKVIPYL